MLFNDVLKCKNGHISMYIKQCSSCIDSVSQGANSFCETPTLPFNVTNTVFVVFTYFGNSFHGFRTVSSKDIVPLDFMCPIHTVASRFPLWFVCNICTFFAHFILKTFTIICLRISYMHWRQIHRKKAILHRHDTRWYRQLERTRLVPGTGPCLLSPLWYVHDRKL